MNDFSWTLTVGTIAGKSYTGAQLKLACDYLWHPENWSRLCNTKYGRFLREVDNKCPDLVLREQYRKEVLNF